MSLSLEQFLERLQASSLMSTADVETFVDALPANDKPQDGEQLARLLVQQQKLTAFQAQQIYGGNQDSLVLGNYIVLDKLGQGGMGMVLKAEHRRMHRLVALKVLSPAATKTPAATKRFLREVEAAAKLEHPNIVTAYDADESGNTHFLVMQYVDGKDLSVLVKKKGPMAVDKAVNCILQAARGLQYAHEQGVIHRDIKPANLLVDAKGTVQILDMGLARLEDTGGNPDQAELTSTGQIMGTVDYMAPEQALSTKDADARSDIYSLGITLWYLLTGRAAYDGDNLTAKLLAHQQSPIPSLAAACSGVSVQLDAVFQKMAAKKSTDRQQTMAEVITDLERCLSPTASAPTITATSSEDSKFQAFISNLDGDSNLTAASPEKTQSTAERAPEPTPSPTISYDSSTEETNLQVDAELSAPTNTAQKAVQTSKPPINLSNRRVQIGAAAASLLIVTGLIWGLTGNHTPQTPPETTTNTTNGIPAIAVAPFDENQATEYQKAWAKYLKLPSVKNVTLPGGATMAFVLIPPGEFTMGSSDDGSQSKDPPRRVKISEPFYLAKFELTQSEWLAVMGNNPSHFKGDLSLPVESVRWEDSKALLRKLNASIAEDGMTFVLPTEAQWEYACRAGTTERWYFGDNESLLSEYGIFKINSVGGTHAVGRLKPNPWGLHDMYGNVWEWCADWYAEFETEPNLLVDPAGPVSGERRVNRGGSWSAHAYSCRSAFRAHNPPTEAYGGIGFRLAIAIESPDSEDITPTKRTPAANTALAFNGKNSYVDVPTLRHDGSRPITIEAIAYHDPHDWDDRKSKFAAHQRRTQSLDDVLFRLADKLGTAELIISGTERSWQAKDSLISGWSLTRSETPVSTGWMHIAHVHQKQGHQIYVNGNLVETTQHRTGSVHATFDADKYFTSIGAGLSATGDRLDGRHFKGRIADVRISNGARYDKNFQPLGPNDSFTKDENTIALYHFDEAGGNILNDASGNNHHGVIVNAQWITTDGQALAEKTNHALEFNGETSVVNTPIQYDGKTPLTVEAYVVLNPDAVHSGPTKTIIADAEKGGFAIENRMGKGVIFLTVHDSKQYVHAEGNIPAANQRVHIAGVIDGSKTRIYADGVMIANSQLEGSIKLSPFKIAIGANPHPEGPAGVFDGTIDEVRISSSARYTESFTPQSRFEPDAETIALYHFDEGDGDVAIDSSGNGHHAKITDAKWVIEGTDRKVAAQVLKAGGHLNLQILDEDDTAKPIQVRQASELPTSPFVVRSISLSNLKGIGNDQLFHLARLRGLHELHLDNTNVTDAGLARLAQLPQLVSISLSHTPAEQSGLTGLRSLHALRSIFISNTISKERLVELASGSTIRELTFSGEAPRITPAVVAEIHESNPHCRIRQLAGSVVGRDPLREMAQWVQQRQGKIKVFQERPKPMQRIVDAEEPLPEGPFEILAVDFSNNKELSNADLEQLTLPAQINEVRLDDTNISNDGLPHLSNCTVLSTITLNRTQVTGRTFAQFGRLSRLAQLEAQDAPLTNETVRELLPLKRLQRLVIGNPQLTGDALTLLAQMMQLQDLSLRKCNIGDEDIQQLATLHRLEKLDLSDTRVTKQGAEQLSKALPRCTITYGPSGDKQAIEPPAAIDHDRDAASGVLQAGGYVTLQLNNATGTTQVKQLDALPTEKFTLRSIYLSNVKDIGNDQLFHLSKLRGLHELHLHNTDVTDKGLQYLTSIDTLRNINLYGTQVTDAGLQHLAALPKLHSVSLSSTPAESTGLAGLRSLKTLRSLLVSEQISKARIIELASIPQLRELRISGEPAQITPAVVAEFHKQNPHCRIRKLKGPVIGRDPERELAEWVRQQGGILTLGDLEAVSGYQDFTANQKLPDEAFRIRAIDLTECEDIVDADLARITDSTFLHELKLGKTKIGDAGVAHLANCTTLGSIWLNKTQITDRSLETLSQLPNLVYYYLHSTQVSANGLKALLRNPQIQGLNLGGEQVKAAVLEPISRMAVLTTLSLWKSDIGDEDIQILSTLHKLEKLDVSGTRVTRLAAEQLSKALPHCKISYGPGDDKITIEPTGNLNSSTETKTSP